MGGWMEPLADKVHKQGEQFSKDGYFVLSLKRNYSLRLVSSNDL